MLRPHMRPDATKQNLIFKYSRSVSGQPQGRPTVAATARVNHERPAHLIRVPNEHRARAATGNHIPMRQPAGGDL